MMLFAIDGKTDDLAVFECMCARHNRRTLTGDWIAGTNHYCTDVGEQEQDDIYIRSVSRLKRVDTLLHRLWAQGKTIDTYKELRHILADAGVEARGEEHFTVFANVVCPSQGEIWYTFGGYPAASAGRWHRLAWPW